MLNAGILFNVLLWHLQNIIIKPIKDIGIYNGYTWN